MFLRTLPITEELWFAQLLARATTSEELDKRVSDFGASVVGDACGSALDVLHQPVEVVTRVGDADHADGGLIPNGTGLEFGDRDVERRTETILEAACDLALVFERLRRFDTKFERKESNHGHGCRTNVCRALYIVTLGNCVRAASHTQGRPPSSCPAEQSSATLQQRRPRRGFHVIASKRL